jgi:hypothetical protein
MRNSGRRFSTGYLVGAGAGAGVALVALDFFFFFLVDFVFFGSAAGLAASADFAGAAAGVADLAGAATAGGVAEAGDAGAAVCACAVSANAPAIMARRILLICCFFRGRFGVDTMN